MFLLVFECSIIVSDVHLYYMDIFDMQVNLAYLTVTLKFKFLVLLAL